MLYDEPGYLSLMEKTIKCGRLSSTQRRAKTLSVFGEQIKFDLSCNRLPMLTTKKISFVTAAKELLWLISGDTNQRTLEAEGVELWKTKSSRVFLDKRQLFHYTEYETLGPIQGFQWRHFGANYIDAHTNYTLLGVDQLKRAIFMCKNQPESRSIILNSWNPADLGKMTVTPDLVSMQLFVNVTTNELSSYVYQRSADLLLTAPYQITSCALLTHIIAQLSKLTASKLTFAMGDAHIYETYVCKASHQISLKPLDIPKIQLLFDHTLDIDSLRLSHFNLVGYKYISKHNVVL